MRIASPDTGEVAGRTTGCREATSHETGAPSKAQLSQQFLRYRGDPPFGSLSRPNPAMIRPGKLDEGGARGQRIAPDIRHKQKTPTRGSGRHPNPIPLASPRTGAMGLATRRMRSLSARKTRMSHRCASPKSIRRVASPLGARVRVSTAGSDAAQGVGLSRPHWIKRFLARWRLGGGTHSRRWC